MRETRHVSIGSVPDDLRDEAIKKYFESNVGRVHRIERRANGLCIISFYEMRQAMRALRAEHRIDGHVVRCAAHIPVAAEDAAHMSLWRCDDSTSEDSPAEDDRTAADDGVSEISPAQHEEEEEQHGGLIEHTTATVSPISDDNRHDDSSSSQQSVSSACDSGGPVNAPSSSATQLKPGFVVKHLPPRSTDAQLKEALFYKFTRQGKVAKVCVTGDGDRRSAAVLFRSGTDVDRIVCSAEGVNCELNGVKLQLDVVSPAKLALIVDNERRPFERGVDELHPRSSRTLYVGNLEKRVTDGWIEENFGVYGPIVVVDIKNRDSSTPFAFVQYADISSVVKAILDVDPKRRDHGGRHQPKVGFGKTLHCSSVWLGGLPEDCSDDYLRRKMVLYGKVEDIMIDVSSGQAVVSFASTEHAQECVRDLKMKRRTIGNCNPSVDYGSTQLHDYFLDRRFKYSKAIPSSSTSTTPSSTRRPPPVQSSKRSSQPTERQMPNRPLRRLPSPRYERQTSQHRSTLVPAGGAHHPYRNPALVLQRRRSASRERQPYARRRRPRSRSSSRPRSSSRHDRRFSPPSSSSTSRRRSPRSPRSPRYSPGDEREERLSKASNISPEGNREYTPPPPCRGQPRTPPEGDSPVIDALECKPDINDLVAMCTAAATTSSAGKTDEKMTPPSAGASKAQTPKSATPVNKPKDTVDPSATPSGRRSSSKTTTKSIPLACVDVDDVHDPRDIDSLPRRPYTLPLPRFAKDMLKKRGGTLMATSSESAATSLMDSLFAGGATEAMSASTSSFKDRIAALDSSMSNLEQTVMNKMNTIDYSKYNIKRRQSNDTTATVGTAATTTSAADVLKERSGIGAGTAIDPLGNIMQNVSNLFRPPPLNAPSTPTSVVVNRQTSITHRPPAVKDLPPTLGMPSTAHNDAPLQSTPHFSAEFDFSHEKSPLSRTPSHDSGGVQSFDRRPSMSTPTCVKPPSSISSTPVASKPPPSTHPPVIAPTPVTKPRTPSMSNAKPKLPDVRPVAPIVKPPVTKLASKPMRQVEDMFRQQATDCKPLPVVKPPPPKVHKKAIETSLKPTTSTIKPTLAKEDMTKEERRALRRAQKEKEERREARRLEKEAELKRARKQQKHEEKQHVKQQQKKHRRRSHRSSDSDGGSSMDEAKRAEKRALQKEFEDIMACLSDEPAGQSMYDRVKRTRRAGGRITAQQDDNDSDQRHVFLDELKHKRDNMHKKKRRVTTGSTEESDDGSDSHSDEDRHRVQPNLDDVYGVGESSDDKEKTSTPPPPAQPSVDDRGVKEMEERLSEKRERKRKKEEAREREEKRVRALRRQLKEERHAERRAAAMKEGRTEAKRKKMERPMEEEGKTRKRDSMSPTGKTRKRDSMSPSTVERLQRKAKKKAAAMEARKAAGQNDDLATKSKPVDSTPDRDKEEERKQKKKARREKKHDYASEPMDKLAADILVLRQERMQREAPQGVAPEGEAGEGGTSVDHNDIKSVREEESDERPTHARKESSEQPAHVRTPPVVLTKAAMKAPLTPGAQSTQSSSPPPPPVDPLPVIVEQPIVALPVVEQPIVTLPVVVEQPIIAPAVVVEQPIAPPPVVEQPLSTLIGADHPAEATLECDPSVEVQEETVVDMEINGAEEELTIVDEGEVSMDPMSDIVDEVIGRPSVSEQKSDATSKSSHVDEIIHDMAHGYIEIDAELLMKMSAEEVRQQQLLLSGHTTETVARPTLDPAALAKKMLQSTSDYKPSCARQVPTKMSVWPQQPLPQPPQPQPPQQQPPIDYIAQAQHQQQLELNQRMLQEQLIMQQQQEEALLLQQFVPQQPAQINIVQKQPEPVVNMVTKKYPVRWQGHLSLKNVEALVQMHYISGNEQLVERALRRAEIGTPTSNACLRINKRMRLEEAQLEGVRGRMVNLNDYCVLLALPCGISREDIVNNSARLGQSFIEYLGLKVAAGIVDVAPVPNALMIGEPQFGHVIHMFPPCHFSDDYLLTASQDLLSSVRERQTPYMFIVVTHANPPL